MKATPSVTIGFGIAILVETGLMHLMLQDHPVWRWASLALGVSSLLWLVGQICLAPKK